MIFVPFTRIWPPTFEALDGWAVTPVKMTADDSYLEFFRTRWKEGRAFTVVEHDVVVQPGQLERLESCTHQWCCCPEDGLRATFSIVRFRAGFIRDNARVWDNPHRAGQPSWTYLDTWLYEHADRPVHAHRDIGTINGDRSL